MTKSASPSKRSFTKGHKGSPFNKLMHAMKKHPEHKNKDGAERRSWASAEWAKIGPGESVTLDFSVDA